MCLAEPVKLPIKALQGRQVCQVSIPVKAQILCRIPVTCYVMKTLTMPYQVDDLYHRKLGQVTAVVSDQCL